MVLRLLRTLRLDPSDTFVYSPAAEPGQWAVPGSFMFHGADPEALTGKDRQAFRGGFLGIEDFGWSTLTVVVDATPQERAAAIETLATQFMQRLGAPDMTLARAAATEEIDFAASLAGHPLNTVVALQRHWEDGETRERFRTIERRENRLDPIRAFHIIADETPEEGPDETIDLAGLMGERKT